MTKTNFKKSFIEITAALFVLLYLYTGLTKAMHNEDFNAAMKHSPLIALFSEQLAIIIPVIEIIISIADYSASKILWNVVRYNTDGVIHFLCDLYYDRGPGLALHLRRDHPGNGMAKSPGAEQFIPHTR